MSDYLPEEDPFAQQDVPWPAPEDLDVGAEPEAFDPADRDSATLDHTPPVVWRDLDADTAPAEWRRLREWVEWFVARYRIDVKVVPSCWWQHGDLVEELSALRQAHVVWFDVEDQGLGPITWHEHLHTALQRLRESRSWNGCTDGHEERPPRDIASQSPQGWEAWITESHDSTRVSDV